MNDATEQITSLFEEVAAEVWLHAVDIDTGATVDVAGDQTVAMASMFKIPILVTLANRVSEGGIDPNERIDVTPEQHVPGGTGLSVFSDPATVSLRDLALLMMTVSDNTATDIVLDRLGVDSVRRQLSAMGLHDTRVVHNCADILTAIFDELREELADGLVPFSEIAPAKLAGLSVVDPSRTNATTARDMTRLLTLIWCDQAGPADACAEARRIMELQVWPHRLASDIPEGARYAGKTGTLPGIRNEAGVIALPDGGRYAVAVFTRAADFRDNRPDIDRAIGHAGRLAVEDLRQRAG